MPSVGDKIMGTVVPNCLPEALSQYIGSVQGHPHSYIVFFSASLTGWKSLVEPYGAVQFVIDFREAGSCTLLGSTNMPKAVVLCRALH
jgi:hypothetical protein